MAKKDNSMSRQYSNHLARSKQGSFRNGMNDSEKAAYSLGYVNARRQQSNIDAWNAATPSQQKKLKSAQVQAIEGRKAGDRNAVRKANEQLKATRSEIWTKKK